jgi:4-hydroxy-tetrahydrodipicolinate synthase
MPAITTTFTESLEIDHEFTAKHVKWLVEHGATGIVTNGSLGEGATLTTQEKVELWKTCVKAVGDRVPIIPAIAALSTKEGIELAELAKSAGCSGLMVLPPYVHKGDWNEMKAHVSAIIRATDLSCMLYNNPIAYGVDFLPHQIVELADEHANLNAVKESSGDVRRISAIRELDHDRLALFVGLDDAIVEGIGVGAVGWVAGLVNALPEESIRLFEMAKSGSNCDELYHWFLPLLRLDVVPKFVQLIKLVQAEVGMGNTHVRLPRIAVSGTELDEAMAIITKALSKKANA